MRNPKTSFDLNIKSLKELHEIHRIFELKMPAMDLSEVLRAEYVMIVSALDCYIHDIVRTKMKRLMFDNIAISALPSHFSSFKIPLGKAKQLLDAQTEEEKDAIVSQTLKETLYKFSFESEQTVEQAMSYIGIKGVWTKLKPYMSMEPCDIKTNLNIIVRRRNSIAHQSDISNLTTMEKDSITRDDVDVVMEFIKKLVDGMDNIIVAQIP